MAVKKLYLDKRTLKTPTIGGSEANLQNVLDLKEYIQDVVDDSTTDFTSINVDTINESTAAHGVIVDGVILKDTTVDVNGTADAIILDADADTTISAPTDDQIDIEIAGADDFTFTANTFTALSGSTIKTNTIAETTGSAGVTCSSTLKVDLINENGAGNSVRFQAGTVLINSSGYGEFAGGLGADTIAERTLTAGVTVDGALIKDGGVSNAGATIFAGFYPIAAEQALSTSGTPAAVNVTSYHTKLTSTGTGDAVTLAVGSVPGQMKKVTYVAEGAGGDTVILTPSVTTGFATATFNAVGDFVVFIFNGTYWSVIENSGATIA